MANIKSVKKHIKQSDKRALQNSLIIGNVRANRKKVEVALSNNDINADNVFTLFKNFQKTALSAVNKKIVKLGTMSRQISRLHHKIKKKFELYNTI